MKLFRCCPVCGIGITPIQRWCSTGCHRADCPEDYRPDDIERDDDGER